MMLPHREERAIHWGDFCIEWCIDQDKGQAQYVSLQSNCSVLQLKTAAGRSSSTMEVMPIAAREIELPGADDNILTHLTMKTVVVSRVHGSRKADSIIKIGKVVDVEDMSVVIGVRWATEEEMNALAEQYYERPKTMDKGDVYLPEKVNCALGFHNEEGGGDTWFYPKQDAFEYFQQLRAMLATNVTSFAEFIAADYDRYTRILVVEKEYPKYLSGKSSKATKEGAQKLQAALQFAGEVLAAHVLSDRTQAPFPDDWEKKISLLTQADLPLGVAKLCGFTIGGKSAPSPKAASTSGKKPSSKPNSSGLKTPKQPTSKDKRTPVSQATRITQLEMELGVVRQALDKEKQARLDATALANAELKGQKREVMMLQSEVRRLKTELGNVHNKWRTPYMQNEHALQDLIDEGMSSTGIFNRMAKRAKVAKRPLQDEEMESASPPKVRRERSRSPGR